MIDKNEFAKLLSDIFGVTFKAVDFDKNKMVEEVNTSANDTSTNKTVMIDELMSYLVDIVNYDSTTTGVNFKKLHLFKNMQNAFLILLSLVCGSDAVDAYKNKDFNKLNDYLNKIK